MSETTLFHDLPYIMPSQAQKHVTHNEALQMLDARLHISVASRILAVPPQDPVEGQRYIVPIDAVDDWENQDGKIAFFMDGSWHFLDPDTGMAVFVEDEAILLIWSQTEWLEGAGTASIGRFERLGVGADSDTSNHLVVSGPATLLTSPDSDHRLAINKNASPDTASLIFQDGYSGRAEIGLSGDDNLSFKVSADGSQWHDAMKIASGTAAMNISALTSMNNDQIGGFRNRVRNGGFSIWQRGESIFDNASSTVQTADGWRFSGISGASSVTVSREELLPETFSGQGQLSDYARLDIIRDNVSLSFDQKVENVRTFAGKQVTLSFFARADAPLTVRCYCVQSFGTGGSAAVGIIFGDPILTASWDHYSFTVMLPSVLGKQIGDNSYLHIQPLRFLSGSSMIVDITGIQLEAGPVATPFEWVEPSLDLVRARRYFRKYQTMQNVNDLGFEMRSTPGVSGTGPYSYSAEL